MKLTQRNRLVMTSLAVLAYCVPVWLATAWLFTR
jgi:hypothetical protein